MVIPYPLLLVTEKEVTGTLDEVQIREIEDRHTYLTNLEKRKTDVLASIEEQGKLTPELEKDIKSASQMQRVEDLYRPYKQKRRTKATIAKEAGLEPLANWVLTFPQGSLEGEAEQYIDEEKGLESVGDVLAGVHEIIAESISDNPEYRKWVRDFVQNTGILESKVKDKEIDEKGVYEMYYEYSETLKTLVPHRVLAMNRGEKEGVLSLSIESDEDRIHRFIMKKELPDGKTSPAIETGKEAIIDAYKRFISPAIERELRNDLTETAEDQAIQVFGENLNNLLLQAP